MNEKGFTLIEIITTITILGIISVVAIPMVNKYLLQSRNKTYDTYVNTLYNATRNYYEKYSMFIPNSGSSETITADTLLKESFIEELVDPENKDEECDYKESKVKVENKATKNADGTVKNNAKLKYYVTLKCHNKFYVENKPMN